MINSIVSTAVLYTVKPSLFVKDMYPEVALSDEVMSDLDSKWGRWVSARYSDPADVDELMGRYILFANAMRKHVAHAWV